MKVKGLVLLLSIVSSLSLMAKDINVGIRTKRVCIGKKNKLFQSGVQFDLLSVNGVSSRRSTFWYNGNYSRLELDFYKADVHATCNRSGFDVFNITYSPAFNDPNRYHLRMQVRCVPCELQRPTVRTKHIKQEVQKLAKVQGTPQAKKLKYKIIKDIKSALKQIDKLLRSNEIDEREYINLLKKKHALEKIYEYVMENVYNDEILDTLLEAL